MLSSPSIANTILSTDLSDLSEKGQLFKLLKACTRRLKATRNQMSNKFVTVEPVENLSIIRKYWDSFPTERDGVSYMQRDPIDLFNWILRYLKECGKENSLYPIFHVLSVGGLREKFGAALVMDMMAKLDTYSSERDRQLVNHALSLLLIQ